MYQKDKNRDILPSFVPLRMQDGRTDNSSFQEDLRIIFGVSKDRFVSIVSIFQPDCANKWLQEWETRFDFGNKS